MKPRWTALIVGFCLVLSLAGCTSILFHLMGGKKPSPQSFDEIREFLAEHQVDLSTAFVIDSAAFYQMGQEGFSLPMFRMYDSTGTLLWKTTGYSTQFTDSIEQVLLGDVNHSHDLQLGDDIERFRTFDGQKVSQTDLPSASYYFVEYWASWCVPCRFQMDAVETYLTQHPDLDIVSVTVNCDLRKSWHWKPGHDKDNKQ